MKSSYNRFYFVSICLEKNFHIVYTPSHKHPIVSHGNLSIVVGAWSCESHNKILKKTIKCQYMGIFRNLPNM